MLLFLSIALKYFWLLVYCLIVAGCTWLVQRMIPDGRFKRALLKRR